MIEAAPITPFVVQALEREREYLAEELHEGLFQNLCGISIQLKVLQRRLVTEAPAFKEEFMALQQTLEQTIDQARSVHRALYPRVTDAATMAQAIGELAQSKRASLECDESFFDGAGKMDSNQAVMFFRIAQEMLRNIAVNQAGASIALRLENGVMKMRIAARLHDPRVSLDPMALDIMRTSADQIGADLKTSFEDGQIEMNCTVPAVSK